MLIMSNSHDEIINIIEALGRHDLTEGNVKGTHLGKILIYLQKLKQEKYDNTVFKLSLTCGMNGRYIRENYLKGLELFGVIKVQMIGNMLVWSWVGDKAFSNNGDNMVIEKIDDELNMDSETPVTDYILKQERKKRKYRNNCKNCDKPIPESIDFCSDECMSKYREKHKKY